MLPFEPPIELAATTTKLPLNVAVPVAVLVNVPPSSRTLAAKLFPFKSRVPPELTLTAPEDGMAEALSILSVPAETTTETGITV